MLLATGPKTIRAGSDKAGGLRIKKMVDYAPGQQPNERNFSYTKTTGVSSGILSGIPKYFVEYNVDLDTVGLSYTVLERILFHRIIENYGNKEKEVTKNILNLDYQQQKVIIIMKRKKNK